MRSIQFEKIGYIIAVLAVSTVVLWNGILKFTPTEAFGIQHYIENSFLMSWTYNFWTPQQVAAGLAVIEIPAAILMIVHLFWKKAGIIAGLLLAGTFCVTLSFLFTTPGIVRDFDGLPAINFSLFKDMMGLGISIIVFVRSLQSDNKS